VNALLLSFRETAKLLGVGRGKTLHELIAAGLLRPVKLLGRSLIPREQIEQLARTGEGPASTPTEPAARKKSKATRSIADLEI
jgi:excisionase family DNA binding protein